MKDHEQQRPPRPVIQREAAPVDEIVDDQLPELAQAPSEALPFAPSSSQWTVAGLFLILASFMGMYRGLSGVGLEQASAMFIGLPAILGALLALSPPAQSVTGMAVKGTTLALLLSAVVLGEGIICILMASPLFYTVAITAGLLVDMARKGSSNAYAGLVVLLLASVEGAHPMLSFDREESVASERVVEGTPSDVRDALARPQRLTALPAALRIGFPRPVDAWGDGLAVGDTRHIHFAGGEGRPGTMQFVVEESAPERVVFALVDDESHIAHWLRWERSVVELEPIDAEHTRVRWRIDFRRDLDPAWYFAGVERWFLTVAADHLIASVATP